MQTAPAIRPAKPAAHGVLLALVLLALSYMTIPFGVVAWYVFQGANEINRWLTRAGHRQMDRFIAWRDED